MVRTQFFSHAVLDIGVNEGRWAVAVLRTDAGVVLDRLEASTPPLSLGTDDARLVVTGFGAGAGASVTYWPSAFRASPWDPIYDPYAGTHSFPASCRLDGGVEALFHAGQNLAVFPRAGAVCLFDITNGAPAMATESAHGYRPVFAYNYERNHLFAAAVDGGVRAVMEASLDSFSERVVWNGGLVDGIVEFGDTAFWVGRDGIIWKDFLRGDAGVVRFTDTLPRPVVVSPVLLPSQEQFDSEGEDEGSLVAVDQNNAVHAFKTSTGKRMWSLGPGDGGIRGGRVDTPPITVNRCAGLDTILIPSAGDGSLYSFITDEKTPEFTARGSRAELSRGWLMWNANPLGNQASPPTSYVTCVPE